MSHFPGLGKGLEGEKVTRLGQTWPFPGFLHLPLKGHGDKENAPGGPVPAV